MTGGIDLEHGSPRIAGTRITVYHICHYLEGGGWQPKDIAAVLNLTVAQVEDAIRYIEQHRDEVMAVHRQIEERIARGNPPEIEAKLAAARAKAEAFRNQLRQASSQGGNGAGHTGGR